MADIKSTLIRRKRGVACSPEEAAAIKAAYRPFAKACQEADRKAMLLTIQTQKHMHKIIN